MKVRKLYRRNTLRINAGERLGLSATPIRYGDPEGTSAIFDYFGGGYPVAYCIDGVQGEDTISRAVTDLLENNTSFYGTDDVYLIDTELVEIGND